MNTSNIAETAKGWTGITMLSSGHNDLCWHVERDGNINPDIYPERIAVEREIIDTQIELLQNLMDETSFFIFEDISWQPDSFPAYIEIDKYNNIKVWRDEDKTDLILSTTLNKWRNSICSNETLPSICQELYNTSGASAVYEYADLKNIPSAPCAPCDAETPTFSNACLICGSKNYTMKELLIDIREEEEVKLWADGKTWKEFYETCPRGSWLLWLFSKTNPNDLQLLTLAKGYCAKTAQSFMRDNRSIAAVDAAIAFGNGEIKIRKLNKAVKAAKIIAYAYPVANTSWSAAAKAAAAAANINPVAAGVAAEMAAVAAEMEKTYVYATKPNTDINYAAINAKSANQLETADIVRKYIPIEKFNIHINL